MERKNFLADLTATLAASRKLLTSVCGILIIASIILTTNSIGLDSQNHSNTGYQLGFAFKASLVILNVIFLLVFLASTLALIKKEDDDKNQSSF